MKPMCRYFVYCDHPADGTIDHPLLGAVPCCQRCAGVVGLDLQPVEEETALRSTSKSGVE